MKDEDKVAESFEEAMKRILARMPPEQRLMGLTEAQAVLALPDAVLRGLSSEFLATLPRQTRAAIQKRLGGDASPRPPVRPPAEAAVGYRGRRPARLRRTKARRSSRARRMRL